MDSIESISGSQSMEQDAPEKETGVEGSRAQSERAAGFLFSVPAV